MFDFYLREDSTHRAETFLWGVTLRLARKLSLNAEHYRRTRHRCGGACRFPFKKCMGETPHGQCAMASHTNNNAMSSRRTQKRKSTLSAHQKEIRFFTLLSVFTGILLFAAFFWLLNWPGFHTP
jgi:hypothetical protein